MSWPLVKLDGLFDIARGGSPRPIQDFITDDIDGINWISISDASKSSKYIEKTKKKIKKEGLTKSRLVNPGDFLLTNSMSFGHPYIMRTSGCIHDGWLVLSPKSENIDTDYFYHLLGSAFVYKHFCRVAAGAVVKNLNIDLVKALKIPLPPLPEQKRIAAILDKADSLRRKNQQAIQLADKFLRAVFLDLFAKQTDVKSCSIGELCEVKGGKRLPAGHDYVDVKSNHPYLRVVDFLNGSIDLTNLKYISHETHKKIQRYIITSDDVFISIAGSIGIAGTIPVNLNGANLTENAAKLVICNKGKILNEYLAYWLNTPEAQMQIANKTMSTSQPKLALFRIEELLCPLPPITDQMKFVKIKRKVFESIVKVENIATGLQLFDSLSQKAFAGEL